jgi:uncharacterized protein YaaR (DUF327 family)
MGYGPDSNMKIYRIDFNNYLDISLTYEINIISTNHEKIMKVNMNPYYVMIFSSNGNEKSNANIKKMIEIIEKKDLKLRQNKYKNVIKFKNLIKARRTRKKFY